MAKPDDPEATREMPRIGKPPTERGVQDRTPPAECAHNWGAVQDHVYFDGYPLSQRTAQIQRCQHCGLARRV